MSTKEESIKLQPGMNWRGFLVTALTPVPALRANVVQLEHKASGATILHVACDDSENAFSINFLTPPPDDSGMPHILEHMVLAGSQKFPVKEPFFEMVKMSMATFINALTGYDCTYYPVCSNVARDLFNLADVYFDAVFHPLLSDMTFEREAHHLAPLDPANPTGELRRDGIVYSEMKGVFSDPESILARHAVRALLPDTCYGKESGGDPAAIPSLTNERLRAFHATHYHPGHALFAFYGNIPTTDYLDFLAPRLESFTHPDSRPPQIERQPRWSEKRLLRDVYPIGANESLNERTYLVLNWICGSAADPEEMARIRLLSLLLLGNEGAPLRRAIVDSRLGSNLVMAGPDTAGLDLLFHIGLDGSEPERLEPFRTLVLQTLQKLADSSFSTEEIDAAFQQASYQNLEIMPMFPLVTVMKLVEAWSGGLNPLLFLDTAGHYEAVRKAVAADPRLFNRLIKDRLLDNPHRLDIVLAPDRECQERNDAADNAALAAERAKLSDDQARQIAAMAAALEEANGRANTAAEVACLPQLRASDLTPEPSNLPTTIEPLEGGGVLLFNDMLTNGIVYLRLRFDLNGLPNHLWPILPHLTNAFSMFGAAGQDFAAIAHRISATSAGISASFAFETHCDNLTLFQPSIVIDLKTLDRLVNPALDLLGDLLFGLDLNDIERMRDVMTQTRSDLRVGMVQQGNATARLHAARGLNLLGHISSLTNGLPQLALTEGWMGDFDAAYPEIVEKIGELLSFILNRRRLSVSLTAPAGVRADVQQRVAAWMKRMANDEIAAVVPEFTPHRGRRCEGLAAPLQIAHCAMLMPAPHTSHPDSALLSVGAHLLTHDYMLPEIRFKGNAYGASCAYSSQTGIVALTSFRDPRIAGTINVFKGALDYVRKADWSALDIERGIIGVAKHNERPLRPSEATVVALGRQTMGASFDRRLERLKRLLRATPESVKCAMLAMLENGMPHAAIAVMSGRAQLEEANKSLGADALAIEEVLKD